MRARKRRPTWRAHTSLGLPRYCGKVAQPPDEKCPASVRRLQWSPPVRRPSTFSAAPLPSQLALAK